LALVKFAIVAETRPSFAFCGELPNSKDETTDERYFVAGDMVELIVDVDVVVDGR
jgi:hypothetical protein